MSFYSYCCNSNQSIEILKEASSMNRPTVYDFMESRAREGHTGINLNLYPRKERQLLNAGFAVQRTGPAIPDYPQQHPCRVDWTHAVEGTVAHHFLELAVAAKPELLQQAEEGLSDPVPPPYSSGGGWEQP